MKVKCLLIRAGGTKVEIAGVEYHFQPDAKTGDHVCEVKDNKHLARFLSISEAYEIWEPEQTKTTAKEPQKPVEVKLLGSDWQPEVVDLNNGSTITTKLLVEAIFNVSGMTVEEWNAQSEDEIKALLIENVENFNDTESATSQSPDEKSALQAEAKVLKIKGAHLMGVDKLKEALANAKAE